MRLALFVASLAAVLPNPVLAQAARHPNPPGVVEISPPDAMAVQGCPVGLTARHANQGALERVSPGAPHPEQGFQLTFEPINARSIAQAKLTLHGLSRAQVIPAGEANNSAQGSEDFTVTPASGPHHLFHATVYSRRLTGVQWIELNAVTYADGATWHEPTPGACRVVPNGWMVVAGKQP